MADPNSRSRTFGDGISTALLAIQVALLLALLGGAIQMSREVTAVKTQVGQLIKSADKMALIEERSLRNEIKLEKLPPNQIDINTRDIAEMKRALVRQGILK